MVPVECHLPHCIAVGLKTLLCYFLKSCNLCITFENSSFYFPKIISVDRSKSYTLLYLKSLTLNFEVFPEIIKESTFLKMLELNF